jgi:peptidyl-prolyl cis-trans isomerase D
MVAAAYRAAESTKLARAAAAEMVADMATGSSLVKLAQKNGYKLEDTGAFTRTYSPFVPRIGTSEELASAAFAKDADQKAIDRYFEIQNRFVVVEVKERIAADMSQLDTAKREELHKSILARKQNEAIEKRLVELRSAATIIISPRVQDVLNKEK